MTQVVERGLGLSEPPEGLAQATEWFLRLRSGDAGVEDLIQFQSWVQKDPENAAAYREVNATWSAVADLASEPEIMLGRRDALEDAQRAARRRWRSSRPRWTHLAAAAVLLVVAATIVGLGSQFRADRYATGVGERHIVTLADGSVVTLDARTRIRVKYGDKERAIALEQGQARFDVAKDPTRPFRVTVGHQTVTALGTQFNVEIVAHEVLVTMIEGRVAVSCVAEQCPAFAPEQGRDEDQSLPPTVIELTTGEALQVPPTGKAIRVSAVNVDRATAWQSGKMFFENEPLSRAAERINRYAHEQIQVDPSAAWVAVSGVFNAGDSAAFIEAVTAYFPVIAERAGGSNINLTARRAGGAASAP